MTVDEFFIKRLQLGLITANTKIVNGRAEIADRTDSIKSDVLFVREIGNTLFEFWENAPSQKHLLWALRSIGLSDVADTIWKDLSDMFLIAPHIKINDIDALAYANIVRMRVANPFT